MAIFECDDDIWSAKLTAKYGNQYYQEGRKDEKVAIAKKMSKLGITTKLIAKSTGLNSTELHDILAK